MTPPDLKLTWAFLARAAWLLRCWTRGSQTPWWGLWGQEEQGPPPCSGLLPSYLELKSREKQSLRNFSFDQTELWLQTFSVTSGADNAAMKPGISLSWNCLDHRQ